MTNLIQMKIELDEITPKIWRRFKVRDDISFQEFHDIIQVVMGWENYHLYEFRVDKEVIASDENEGFNPAEGSFRDLFNSSEFQELLKTKDLKELNSMDINKLNKIVENSRKNRSKQRFSMNSKISELIKKKGQRIHYLYDFGDNWEHIITVEEIIEGDGKQAPICLEGERACPPEDCGSVPGYFDLERIKKNENHKQYKELIVEWLGENFDFELFEIELVNKELKYLTECNNNVEKDELWEEGSFIETVDPKNSKERMKTFHMKHDEDMNYNCNKCSAKMSIHNRDWHSGMCDSCFNKMMK